MEKRLILILLLILVCGIFYYQLTKTPSLQKVEIKRVIDGDTVELVGGQKVRLIGINTPEKGMPGFDDARLSLKEIIEGKEVYLEKIDVDRYKRILGYLFVGEKNINLAQLKSGNAHLYYYEKDKYYNEMEKAEKFARENEIGIWEMSDFSSCIKLVELDYYDKDNDSETLILENTCDITIEVIIKDDATHIYKESLTPGKYNKTLRNIFNDDHDTLYIWDKEGRIVIFHRYS